MTSTTTAPAAPLDGYRADDLVGMLEVADRLGVQKGTVWRWRNRDVMPPATAECSGTPVWLWPELERWARQTGRLAADVVAPPVTAADLVDA